MKTILEFLGGKKIGWCLLLLIASLVLLPLGYITQDKWLDLAKMLTYVVVGGNVAGMGIHAFAKNKEE